MEQKVVEREVGVVKRGVSKVRKRCPACKSTHTWAKGVVPTRQGHKPRAICYACGKTFFYGRSIPVGGVE